MTDITFDDLNVGQKHAFNRIVEILKTPGKHVTLSGSAGTGKTTLTKIILNHLRTCGVTGVMLAAPTHQAKKVLSKLAGMEANTIHSLLRINPTTYEDVSLFEQSETPDLSECKVLICDEVSMYDKQLFKILIASVPSYCTIIGLGDIAQIRPVTPNSTIPEISLFFQNEKFEQLALDEVMRSNAPIVEVATEIREGGWIRENIIDGAGVHNLAKDSAKPVASFMQKYFEIVKTPEDLLETRMLAYTNASVDSLNKIIRKRIYGTDEPFINGEILVMQEPLIRQHTFNGQKITEVKFNNGELVEVLSCNKTTKKLSIGGIMEEEIISIWQLECRSTESEITETMLVIEDKKEMNRFQNYMSNVAGIFKEQKGSGKRPNWKGWWDLKNKFHKVKALPCGTIHKSQGSSVENTFLYTPCIHKADWELAQQLLYVGTTRARTNVYYI